MSHVDLSNLLQALILAGIVALLRFAFNHSNRLRTVETVLTGPEGGNGLRSDVKALSDDMQHLKTEQAVIRERLGMDSAA